MPETLLVPEKKKSRKRKKRLFNNLHFQNPKEIKYKENVFSDIKILVISFQKKKQNKSYLCKQKQVIMYLSCTPIALVHQRPILNSLRHKSTDDRSSTNEIRAIT